MKKGSKMTPEQCANVSRGLKGRVFTDKHRANIGKRHLGRKLSDEAKKAISDKAKERNADPDYRKNLAIKMTGKKQSSDTIAKRVAKNTGKKRTPDQRANISKSLVGHVFSEATKEKIAKTLISNGTCKMENNPNWHGGLSFIDYPPEFNPITKDIARSVFDYQCAMCGNESEDRELDAHHLNYDKKDCRLENLIPLCRKHHLRTNNDRDRWQYMLTYVLQEVYEGNL
jgi:hypothetical protein